MLRILTKQDEIPGLKNKKSWSSFPVQDYDVVAIDSLGSLTEGITEKEGKLTTEAIAILLDLARQGPAILLLNNTVKEGKTFRGRGEWADRLDILYEVRDATGYSPSGKKPWWLDLPEAGEAMWGERAVRRKARTDYRLAFIASKFRPGPEPEPFCLEIRLRKDEPWTLQDVTTELVEASDEALTQVNKAKQDQLENAAKALAEEIGKREAQEPLLKNEAEAFLRNIEGLSQQEARTLIKDNTGILWEERKLPGGQGKGRPVGLLLCG